jgi:glucose/mannose transport system substrate-binding protein
VLSQGNDFYKKAIVDLDQKTLTSDQMVGVFDTVRKIESYFDKGYSGRDWNLATSMVIQGKAGMQFMGDWAKGEFANAGKVAGKDYLCTPAPGTAKGYTFNVDSFVFFKEKGSVGRDAGPARACQDDHDARVPGAVQPEQGLDPGSPRCRHEQIRRMRQAVVRG